MNGRSMLFEALVRNEPLPNAARALNLRVASAKWGHVGYRLHIFPPYARDSPIYIDIGRPFFSRAAT
jgi:hypothetical protein